MRIGYNKRVGVYISQGMPFYEVVEAPSRVYLREFYSWIYIENSSVDKAPWERV